MKRLLKVETNASTIFVTYDTEEKIARMLDNEETNGGVELNDVEDDSSWDIFENVENLEEWLCVDCNNTEASEIVEEIEFN